MNSRQCDDLSRVQACRASRKLATHRYSVLGKEPGMNVIHDGSQSWRYDASSLTRRKALAQGTGTPVPKGGPAPLMDLLACVSDWYRELESDTSQFWFYDDLKQQFDAFGIVPDADDPMPDGSVLVTLPMLTYSGVFDYAQLTDFTDALGFQPLAVHQSLQCGDPDHRLTLFRGGIELDALPALWEAAGYTLADSSSGHEIWTLGGPDDFDTTFTHPIQQYLFFEFNNVTVLGGDILAYAPDITILERAADTRAAETGSLANDPDTESLLAQLPPTTVSCYPVPGAPMVTWPITSSTSSTASWNPRTVANSRCLRARAPNRRRFPPISPTGRSPTRADCTLVVNPDLCTAAALAPPALASLNQPS